MSDDPRVAASRRELHGLDRHRPKTLCGAEFFSSWVTLIRDEINCPACLEAMQPTLADRLDARQDSIHSTDGEKLLRAKVVKREGEAR